jgi:RNA polymerase sigma factor (sigma-70 family)
MAFVGNGALAERVRSGDRAAFGEMYGEFADRIFGFCVVLLRDRDEAADATHDTFVLAAQRAGQLRDPERLPAWLFAIARHVCYRRLDKRKRELPVEIEPDLLTDDADVERGVSADDARALVWAAAEGLNERDRAVLALNTREGLEGAELAAALGVQHANPYSLLSRAKSQLETAVTTLLIARFGRRDCSTLADMLVEWDGTLTPLLRKRLGRHVLSCGSCLRTKGKVLPLSAVALVPALQPRRADALDRRNLDGLLEIAARTPLADEAWLPDGFPPYVDSGERKRRRRFFFLIAAAVGVLVVTVLGVVIAGGASDKDPAAEAAPKDAPTKAPPSTGRGPSTTTIDPAVTTTSLVISGHALVDPRADDSDPVVAPPAVNPGTHGTTSGTTPSDTSPPVTKPPVTTPPSTSPPSTTTTSTFRT